MAGPASGGPFGMQAPELHVCVDGHVTWLEGYWQPPSDGMHVPGFAKSSTVASFRQRAAGGVLQLAAVQALWQPPALQVGAEGPQAPHASPPLPQREPL